MSSAVPVHTAEDLWSRIDDLYAALTREGSPQVSPQRELALAVEAWWGTNPGPIRGERFSAVLTWLTRYAWVASPAESAEAFAIVSGAARASQWMAEHRADKLR
ncbi:hypothetical protein ACFYNY_34620 [Streptomyces sp. NPDC006530]|uniref:hypothetical protein n=1 Tax=Streptomyces sp. NPDC006530 TaxID=3364750 RepID=UPI0036B05619